MTTIRSTEFAAALRSGRLQGIPFPDLLWALMSAEATGVLVVHGSRVEKKVFLDQGQVVFAASSDPDDRLGERLLREGKVSVERLEHAVGQLPSETRIGTLLVEAGSLDVDALTDGVVQQLREIVLSLFDQEVGEYQFDEGAFPDRESITPALQPGELMLMGVRAVKSFGRIRAGVGAPNTLLGLADGWERALEGIRLTEGEELIVGRLRNVDASVDALCREVFLSNFEIYQTLWGLKLIGVIEDRQQRALPGEASRAGTLAEKDFAEVVVELAAENATGVLYVTRGLEERSFHFSEGACRFATSSDIDDGLVAYLLRRGVISLADREETAKRLLSNKRVGTILREMGVIDDRDLQEMVQQHLLEIAFDTFGWSEAEYAFYRDDLPSVEEIILDVPVERLVAEGLCRIDSWQRVRQGCGGFETFLGLTPSYLDILDRMGVGEDEWSVVTALKDGATPRELCADSTLGDFRICQILWSLRVLGAVGPTERPQEQLSFDTAGAAVAAEPAEPADVDAVEIPVFVDDAEQAAESLADESDELEPATAAADVLDADSAFAEDSETEADAALDEVAEVEDADSPAADPEVDSATTGPVRIPVEEAETGPIEPFDVTTGDADADSAESDDDEPAEMDRTQWIPADAVQAALDGTAVDATQRIDPEDVRAAVAAERGDDEPGEHEVSEGKETPGEQTPDEEATEEEDPVEAALAATEDVGSSVIQERIHRQQLEEASQTVGLTQDQVQAALAAGPDGDAWAPPGDLDEVIGRFNAAQRIVFRAVKAEVGAGAANFIRSCCGELEHADTLAGVELQTDGTWDADGLRQAVLDSRIDEPWEGYEELIDKELDLLRMHVGEARVSELQRQVRQIGSGGS